MCHYLEEYHELSAAEEEDLETLLNRDNAIQDAAAFTEHLSEELAHLDQVDFILPFTQMAQMIVLSRLIFGL